MAYANQVGGGAAEVRKASQMEEVVVMLKSNIEDLCAAVHELEKRLGSAGVVNHTLEEVKRGSDTPVPLPARAPLPHQLAELSNDVYTARASLTQLMDRLAI